MPELGELSLRITANTQGTADKILDVASAVDKLESSMSKVDGNGARGVSNTLSMLNNSLFNVTSRAKGAETIVKALEGLSSINLTGFSSSIGDLSRGVGVLDKAMDSIERLSTKYGTFSATRSTLNSMENFVSSMAILGRNAEGLDMSGFNNIGDGVTAFKRAADGISEITKTFAGEKSDKAFESIIAFGEGLIAVNDTFAGANFAPMEAASEAVKTLNTAKNAMKGLAEFGDVSIGKQLSKGVTAFGSGMRRLGEWGAKIDLEGASRFGDAAKAINPAKNALKGIGELFSDENKAASSSAITSFGRAMKRIGSLGSTIDLDGVEKLKSAASGINSARTAINNVQKLFAENDKTEISDSVTNLGKIIRTLSTEMSGVDVNSLKSLGTIGTGIANMAKGMSGLTELYSNGSVEVDKSLGMMVASVGRLGRLIADNISPEQLNAISEVATPLNTLFGAFKTLNDLSDADYSTAIGSMVTAIQSLIASLREISSGDVQRLLEIASAMSRLSEVDNLRDGVSGLNYVKSVIGSASRSFDGMRSSISSCGNALKTIGKAGVSAMRGLIGIVKQMYSGFSSVFNSIGKIGVQAVQRVLSSAKLLGRGFTSAFGIIVDGAKKVASEFGKLVSVAADVGKRIASSLTSAILRGLSSIGSAGTSAISGLVKNITKSLSSVVPLAGKIAKSGIGGLISMTQQLYKSFSLGMLFSNGLFRSLLRVAKMRALRSLIAGITKSFKEGLESLSKYSSEAATTMNNLASQTTLLKANFAAALYPAIAACAGIFHTLTNAVITALNAIGQLFAILGGSSTYMKAVAANTDAFGSSASKSAGSAKALKQELMGFDEINSLSPDSGGGGGGGGAGSGGLGDVTWVTESIGQNLKDMVASGDFTELGVMLGEKINAALEAIDWNNVIQKAEKLAKSLTTFLNGIIATIDAKLVGESIAGVINTATTFVSDFWNDTDWSTLGSKVGTAINTAITGENGIDPKKLAEAITGKFKAMFEFLESAEAKLDWESIGNSIGKFIDAAIANVSLPDAATTLTNIIIGAVTAIDVAFDEATIESIATQITDALTNAINSIPEIVGTTLNIGAKVANAIAASIEGWFDTNIKGKSFSDLCASAWSTLTDTLSYIDESAFADGTFLGIASDMASSIWRDVSSWFETNIKGKSFTELCSDAWTYVKGVFSSFGNLTFEEGSLISLAQQYSSAIWSSVTEWFEKNIRGKTFAELCGDALEYVEDVFVTLSDMVFGEGTLEQLKTKFSNALSSLFENPADFVVGLAKQIGSMIGKAFRSIPWRDIISRRHEFARSLSSSLNEMISSIPAMPIGVAISTLIKTGISFIATFWSKTDWGTLGSKLGSSLNAALLTFDASEFAVAIFGKLQAMFTMLDGFVQSANWSAIGVSIGKFLNSAIDSVRIPSAIKTLSDLLLGVLTSIDVALDEATIKKIANQLHDALVVAINAMPAILGKTINIAAKLANAIWESINSWFRENVAGKSFTELCSEAWGYIRRVFDNVDVEINGIVALGNMVVAGGMAASLIKSAISAMGFSFGGFGMTGAVAMITATFKILADFDAAFDESEVSGSTDEILKVVGDVLTAGIAGAMVLGLTGNAGAAIITFNVLYHVFASWKWDWLDDLTNATADVANELTTRIPFALESDYGSTDPNASHQLHQWGVLENGLIAQNVIAANLLGGGYAGWEQFLGSYKEEVQVAAGISDIANAFNELHHTSFSAEMLSEFVGAMGLDTKDIYGFAYGLAEIDNYMSEGRLSIEDMIRILKALGYELDETLPVDETVSVDLDVDTSELEEENLIPDDVTVPVAFAPEGVEETESIVEDLNAESIVIDAEIDTSNLDVDLPSPTLTASFNRPDKISPVVMEDHDSPFYGIKNTITQLGVMFRMFSTFHDPGKYSDPSVLDSILAANSYYSDGGLKRYSDHTTARPTVSMLKNFGIPYDALNTSATTALSRLTDGMYGSRDAVKDVLESLSGVREGITSVSDLNTMIGNLFGMKFKDSDLLDFMQRMGYAKDDFEGMAFAWQNLSLAFGQPWFGATDISKTIEWLKELGYTVEEVLPVEGEVNVESEGISEVSGEIGELASDLGEIGVTVFPVEVDVKSKGIETVIDGIGEVGKTANDLDGKKSTVNIENVVTTKTNVNNKVSNKVTTDTSSVKSFIDTVPSIKTAAKSISTVMANASVSIGNLGSSGNLSSIGAVKDKIAKIADAAATVTNAIVRIPVTKSASIKINTSSAEAAVKSINDYINAIKGKTVTVTINYKETNKPSSDIINNITKSTASLPAFASGGFLKGADLFVANENGAELVGRIGSAPAVANQQQIGDAIFQYMDKYGQQRGSGISAEAIASAVVSGCKAAGLGAVYLDGKMLANSINRETQRSGRPAITF